MVSLSVSQQKGEHDFINMPAQQHDKPIENPNTLFYNAFQNASNGILIVNADMNIVFANNYMFQNFGFSSYLPGNLTFCKLFTGSLSSNIGFQCRQTQDCENCVIRNSLYKIICYGSAVEGITFNHSCFTGKKEKLKWFLINGNPLFFDNGIYGMLTFVDITLYKHKEKQLLKRLELDLSTHTLNKHSLLKNIDGLLTEGNKGYFTLCMIDFDCFKKLNDQHGHIMGDEVLKKFSQISRKNIRTNDMIGRYGGDEFIFAFPDTGLEEAAAIIIRIQKQVKEYFSNLLPYLISFSAGMLHVNAYQTATSTGLINQVDKLMYQAKEHGKNRIVTINKEYQFF